MCVRVCLCVYLCVFCPDGYDGVCHNVTVSAVIITSHDELLLQVRCTLCVYVCVCVCARVCVRVCVYVCVLVCVLALMNVFVGVLSRGI